MFSKGTFWFKFRIFAAALSKDSDRLLLSALCRYLISWPAHIIADFPDTVTPRTVIQLSKLSAYENNFDNFFDLIPYIQEVGIRLKK